MKMVFRWIEKPTYEQKCALPLTIFVAFFLARFVLKRSTRKSKELQVPYSPFSAYETVREISFLRGHKLFHNSFKKVGPLFLIRGAGKAVFVGDIDIVRDVVNDRSAQKTNRYKDFLLAHGEQNDIFTTNDVSFHSSSRKAMSHAFSSKHIKRMKDISIHHTELFVKNRLEKEQLTESVFDISAEMICLTLDIILDAAFQYKMPPDEKKQFLHESEIILKEIYQAYIPFRYSFLGRHLIPGVRRAKEAQLFTRKVALQIINNYKHMKKTSPQSIVKGTVIDQIMNNNVAYKNDDNRIADIIILVFAGHDTTSHSLSWTFIELAKHEAIQMDLQKELLKKEVTTTTNMEESTSRQNTTLLDAVIKESMRFHPVIGSGIGRTAGKDYRVDNKKNGTKCFIPKGTKLVLCPMIYSFDNDYFKDPYEWKPSRWYADNENDAKALAQQEAAFIPFALGRRNCIGQSLAKAQLYSIIPRIISEYHLSIHREGTEISMATLKPKEWLLNVKRCSH